MMAQILASYCNSYHLILCQSSWPNTRTLALVLQCMQRFCIYSLLQAILRVHFG